MTTSKKVCEMARMIAKYCRSRYHYCNECPFNVEANLGSNCMFHQNYPLSWKIEKVERSIICDFWKEKSKNDE